MEKTKQTLIRPDRHKHIDMNRIIIIGEEGTEIPLTRPFNLK